MEHNDPIQNCTENFHYQGMQFKTYIYDHMQILQPCV